MISAQLVFLFSTFSSKKYTRFCHPKEAYSENTKWIKFLEEGRYIIGYNDLIVDHCIMGVKYDVVGMKKMISDDRYLIVEVGERFHSTPSSAADLKKKRTGDDGMKVAATQTKDGTEGEGGVAGVGAQHATESSTITKRISTEEVDESNDDITEKSYSSRDGIDSKNSKETTHKMLSAVLRNLAKKQKLPPNTNVAEEQSSTSASRSQLQSNKKQLYLR